MQFKPYAGSSDWYYSYPPDKYFEFTIINNGDTWELWTHPQGDKPLAAMGSFEEAKQVAEWHYINLHKIK